MHTWHETHSFCFAVTKTNDICNKLNYIWDEPEKPEVEI